jgi:hypothetical protein
MAWIKEITHPDHGAVASYWEVMSVYYDHRRQLSTLQVGGWVSVDEYNSNMSPLLIKIYEIETGLAPQLAQGAVSFVAGYARAQDEFSGSQNA